MLKLADKWAPLLNAQPEAGMGWQVTTVCLRNGSTYRNVVIQGGYVTSVSGSPEIPFNADEIVSIEVTSP